MRRATSVDFQSRTTYKSWEILISRSIRLVTWFFQSLGVLIQVPWLAFVLGALFGGLYRLSDSTVIATASAAWLLYGAYEYLMYFRVLCSGECNIRVDLLLIYPVLVLLGLWALAVFFRARMTSKIVNNSTIDPP